MTLIGWLSMYVLFVWLLVEVESLVLFSGVFSSFVYVLPVFGSSWLHLINSKLYIFCAQTVSGVIAVGTSHGLALVFGESKLDYPPYMHTIMKTILSYLKMFKTKTVQRKLTKIILFIYMLWGCLTKIVHKALNFTS